MMFLRILLGVCVYILIICVLFIMKPSIMFDINGDVKDVGFTDENRSLLSLYIVAPILAVFVYMVMFIIWR